ncbi:unnamed protein product [Rotaria sordida]|uniref:HSF-type DNA-binding domain-containing protein n=1 Tax=Rotaria sordida TaxID=392033 RepID=A0A813U9X5_9BILA|nr:unnamed protein product [Rotaria sordida]CAF3674212.1 unnamed protein product [Rotaria sordida]
MNSKNIGDDNHGEYIQHPSQSSQSSITAFLAKLWALVNDSSCDDLIAWDPSGGSFHVYDQSRFAREILPRYFKHNNFASFIRQLNMYGFRKMSTIEHGSLKNERDDIEFAHPNFIRGQDSLLELIKRRAPETQQKPNLQGGSNPSSALVSANYLDSISNRSIELRHLLEDVRNLQTKQTSLSDKLSYMQSENQALWGEIGSLRQKHSKQQQIVSKLMEFLLHIITTNTSQSNEQLVEQQIPNEVLTPHSIQPEQADTSNHINNVPLILNEQVLSPHTLKRKQAALINNEEPNKRSTMQQQQHQQFSQPTNFGRQQSVTINELADNDTSGWFQTTNASPLIDLVPSPPLSAPSSDDIYQQQQQQNDYQLSTPTNEFLNPSLHDPRNRTQQNQTFPTVTNEDKIANTYTPDFILCTDGTNGKNINIGQTPGTNLTGIQTSHGDSIKKISIPLLLKEEHIEFPNAFQQNQHNPIDELETSPTLNSTLYSQNQQANKIDPPSAQISFSLDDITGDVDHIQSSLDSIRELMFDNLPEGTSIEDLFGDDNGLLLPLLQSTTNDNQTGNLLLENLPEQTSNTGNNNFEPIETTINSQSVPNINNQLFEQLITETAINEEQRNTIEHLEREKLNLTDKIHILEKQATERK